MTDKDILEVAAYALLCIGVFRIVWTDFLKVLRRVWRDTHQPPRRPPRNPHRSRRGVEATLKVLKPPVVGSKSTDKTHFPTNNHAQLEQFEKEQEPA
jgi:hypothetical protein